ncbi:MAG: alpha/beta hydrolase, partial [Thermomicrobiales bacterium]
RQKRVWVPIGVLAGLIVSVLVAFNVSPWPGAMLIRSVFESDAANVKKAMMAHAPQGIALIENEQYREGDKTAHLDVHFPETAANDGAKLPTVIWTHGGAWISGSKSDAVPYFQLIAEQGYTVIALNYALGPDSTYPTGVHQLNDALAFIQQNADRYHVDTSQIFLAGDSAGAQLTSQLATLITNPTYATELGITPALKSEQLRGLVLNCGIYDMHAYFDHGDEQVSGLLVWGTNLVVWAYTGSRSKDSTAVQQMSTINYVTSAFPPTYISGGNADPLTERQSKPFATKLESLGVETTPLFYADDHEPALAHEYQFKLDNTDGQNALTVTLEFLKDHSK